MIWNMCIEQNCLSHGSWDAEKRTGMGTRLYIPPLKFLATNTACQVRNPSGVESIDEDSLITIWSLPKSHLWMFLRWRLFILEPFVYAVGEEVQMQVISVEIINESFLMQLLLGGNSTVQVFWIAYRWTFKWLVPKLRLLTVSEKSQIIFDSEEFCF